MTSGVCPERNVQQSRPKDLARGCPAGAPASRKAQSKATEHKEYGSEVSEVMKKPLLGLTLWLLLLCPGLMCFNDQVIQKCSNGSYEITVLIMKNSAFPEAPENLESVVKRGVEIVRKRLKDDGKNMVTESSSSLGSKGC